MSEPELPWMIGQQPAIEQARLPRLLYWDTARGTWRPVGELTSLGLMLANDGSSVAIHFRRLDMTDAEFAEIQASHAA